MKRNRGPAGKKKALVVDNDRFYVEFIGDILYGQGYQVIKAYDGLQALEKVEEESPDLVFLDIVMPKIDGDRVCQNLKGNPSTRDIPVVILSATMAEDKAKILEMGAEAYIAKGRIEDLKGHILTTIRRLERRGVEREARETILGLDKAHPRELVKELLAIRRHREALLRNMGEGVVEVDLDEKVIYVNPAGLRVLEKTEPQLIGRHYLEIFKVQTHARVKEILEGLVKTGYPRDEALTIPYRDRVLKINFATVWDGPNYDGFFMIIQDITELAKKIEELSVLNKRLQELDRLKNDFLAIVSHDLHTPLTAIKGSLEILSEENTGVELRKELTNLALINTDHLSRMVSNLLDMAAIERGRLDIQKEAFDLPISIRSVMERVKSLADKKGISMDLAVEGDAPLLIMADPTRIEQVLINLLGNAIKFTSKGGSIRVNVAERPRDVLVGVRDSGIGIPEKYLDRVFDRFFRVPSKGRPEGTGLGLSIAKAIVEEHGGRIWVEAKEGGGSQFYFTLPKE